MPEDNINKRMYYFDRQFLRARDFKVEQQYHIDRHRRHNRLLHTPGVATPHDLTVMGEEGDLLITVTAGTAIDKEGREIILLKPRPITLPFELGETLEVVINFQDKPDDRSSDPGLDDFTRVTEEPNVQIVGSEITPELKQMINEGTAFRLARMEVVIDDNAKTAKLKADPDNSIRTLAGIVAGTGTTFATVTASSLELKKGNTSTVQITNDGVIRSPKWKVTEIFKNRRAEATEPNTVFFTNNNQFESAGGTLLIFASGSGTAKQIPAGQSVVIGVQLLLDDAGIGEVQSFVKNQDPQPFVTTFLTVRNVASGIHKLTLKTLGNTTVGGNDFFNATILELPF